MKANTDEDEQSLIEAAQADPARFVDLYERHFHRVYAYVSRRASSRDVAEDVTSEVFEHALTNTTESPERTTTAPWACLAILPVSIETFDPCRSISTVCNMNIPNLGIKRGT